MVRTVLALVSVHICTAHVGGTEGVHRELHRRGPCNAPTGVECRAWKQEKIQRFSGVLTQDDEHRTAANGLVGVASQVCAALVAFLIYHGSSDADLGNRLGVMGSRGPSTHYSGLPMPFSIAETQVTAPPSTAREAGSKLGCSRQLVPRAKELEGVTAQLETRHRG